MKNIEKLLKSTLLLFVMFAFSIANASVLISSIQYVNEDGETQPVGQFVFASGEIKFYLELFF